MSEKSKKPAPPPSKPKPVYRPATPDPGQVEERGEKLPRPPRPRDETEYR